MTYPMEDWRDEVANGDTRLGYTEWFKHMTEIAEPMFRPEGEPDKYRDLWTENMPRVSGRMWFAIPGEQPIHVSDDMALRILEMLSTEEYS